MNNMQKAGGFGAAMEALYFLAVLLVVALVLPGMGLVGLEALNDPARVLPLWSTSPVLYLLNGLDLPHSAGLMLLVLALGERMQAGGSQLWRPATAAGLVATGLFLTTGMTALIGIPPLARLYPGDANGAGAAYLAVNGMNAALGYAAVFAYGGWLLLANWAALKLASFPKLLAYLGLLLGGVCVVFFAVPLVAPLTLILGLAWSAWVSAVLLRERTRMATR